MNAENYSMSAPRFCWRQATRVAVWAAALGVCAVLASSGDPSAPASLAPPITNLAAWKLVTAGANASVVPDGDGIRVDITAPGSAAWTAQLETPVDLQEGVRYTVHFAAKADPARDMPVAGGLTVPDYHLVGLQEKASLTPAWKDYDYTFQAKGVAEGHTDAPQFQVGDKAGQVWLSNVTVTAVPPPSTFDPLLAQLVPRPGEVKLTGTLRQIRPDQDRLLMLATTAADSGAWPKALKPPRTKVIQWSGAALLVVKEGRASAAAAQPGDTVVATGTSSGDGQPLATRVLVIYPPDHAQNAAP
jgi:hypothetical protein